jgi:leader peptidase (prepilin peptidase)/N-methyltransferase
MVMVGSFLGLRGALLALFLGSLSGSILGYAYMLIARKDPKTYELPFGTFLSAAALVVGMMAQKLLL